MRSICALRRTSSWNSLSERLHVRAAKPMVADSACTIIP